MTVGARSARISHRLNLGEPIVGVSRRTRRRADHDPKPAPTLTTSGRPIAAPGSRTPRAACSAGWDLVEEPEHGLKAPVLADEDDVEADDRSLGVIGTELPGESSLVV